MGAGGNGAPNLRRAKSLKKPKGWYEFQLHFPKRGYHDWQNENYKFIRANLIPIIEKLAIEEFSIANILGSDRDYVRFRANIDDSAHKALREHFDEWKGKLIREYSCKDWDPRKEVVDSLEGCRKFFEQVLGEKIESESWKVAFDMPGLLHLLDSPRFPFSPPLKIVEGDYEKKVKGLMAVETLAGKVARAFMKEFEARPDDASLIDDFIHEILISLGYSHPEEWAIRAIRAQNVRLARVPSNGKQVE